MDINNKNSDILAANLFGEEPVVPVNTNNEKSKGIYFETLALLQDACEKLKDPDSGLVDCNQIKENILSIIKLLEGDKRMLMGLANAPYPYIIRQFGNRIFPAVAIHGTNVMIYSLMISQEFGVPDNRLPYIGVASIASRFGYLDADFDTIIKSPASNDLDKVFSKYEKESQKYINRISIENFHLESIGFLINFIKEEEQVLNKTSLHDAIYQYAMIIHICSEFEKLTHEKIYGTIYSPVEAMRKMKNEMRDIFNQDIIKTFFNKLSIYPLGSFVKLSSKETAKIVDINEDFIMRPTVMVVLDSEDREKPEPVRINLREKPNIYIKRAIVDDFLTERFIDLF